jgi:hypothetical protein
MIVRQIVFEYVVQHFQAVLTFTGHNTIWRQERFVYGSLGPRLNQKCLVVAAVPV